MSTEKAKRKAKPRTRRKALKDLVARKRQTRKVTGGSNANFPPGKVFGDGSVRF